MSEVLGTPSVERQGFEPLLLLEGVTKSYDGWSKALDDVSLSVARGEFVSIIGCSGAGKSTLLRCVNRLIDPTQGSVVFDGDDVTHVRGRALRQTRRRIAMVFQHYNLVYRATAIENVLQGRLGYKSAVAGMLGLFSEDEKRRAFEILDQVGLADFAYARTDQLSGGQKQRVGIARALHRTRFDERSRSHAGRRAHRQPRPEVIAHGDGAPALGGRRAGRGVPG